MADIFGDNTDKTEIDPDKDYLSELVGEGKKFKDHAALARGKAESDAFIARLLAEQEEMRQELNKRIAADEVYDKIASLTKTAGKNDDEENPPSDVRKDALTPEELEEFLEKKLAAKEQASILKNNEKLVASELVKRFGSEELANSEIRRKAKELEVTTEKLQQIAQRDPKVFLQLFPSTSTPPPAPPRGVNAAGMASFTPTGHRTKSHWDRLKAENPAAYFSREAMIERHNDAVKLGEAFFDK